MEKRILEALSALKAVSRDVHCLRTTFYSDKSGILEVINNNGKVIASRIFQDFPQYGSVIESITMANISPAALWLKENKV